MQKLWEGRFSKAVDKEVNDFNNSLPFDCVLFEVDILGSIAHVTMLSKCGIILDSEKVVIIQGLNSILNDIKSGELLFDYNCEDIHSFVEQVLTERVGTVGKKLHTARSRNDQVAVDLRMYVANEIDQLKLQLKTLIHALCNISKKNLTTIMSGYTHLQKAQPITFAHNLLAYAQMFLRDIKRLNETKDKVLCCPLGAGALATTTYPIDRQFTAELLGFNSICMNSIDAVSDRDYCVEFASDLSIIMMHLSRFSEEVILWSSWEFGYVELDDSYSTGSSIMPQKKNPDIAELVRGKSGRVYGSLFSILTVLKGLPLAYNKDMQEDKQMLFDSIFTVKTCLSIFTPMLETMKIKKDVMRKSAENGYINATDCADYLVKKGLAFRDAYKITGKIVAFCIESKKSLESMDVQDYKTFSELFDTDIFDAINLENCVNNRIVIGGPSKDSSLAQIEYCINLLEELV